MPVLLVSAGLFGLPGCSSEREDDSATSDGIGSGIDTNTDADTEDTDPTDATDPDGNDGPLLDMGNGEGAEGMDPCGEGELCEGDCDIPEHVPCDAAANSPLAQTIGLNCPGEPVVQFSMNGNASAMGRRNAFGNAGAFPPREGSGYAVIGSGAVADLDGAADLFLTYCSKDLAGGDVGTLPAPIVPTNVGAQTCTENPALIGTGDCSNTIAGQLTAGAFDYTELKFTTVVPTTVNSLSYDLAFFSIEYPDYYQSQFNDMYIGWLESEAWTGNISFDTQGNPISLNAGFLDYKDSCAPGDTNCGSAPALHGTCMETHAGTKWLTSTAGVKPGEQITVLFAIFDQGDGVLDSYVFLDNFQWGCEGDLPPQTVPIG
jgi:hypothetical protein